MQHEEKSSAMAQSAELQYIWVTMPPGERAEVPGIKRE